MFCRLTTFDLVMVVTGQPKYVIAVATSAFENFVLHLNPNPFYGSHSSLSLPELTSFLNSNSTTPPLPPQLPSTITNGYDYSVVILTIRFLYSNTKISYTSPELLDEHSRKLNLDFFWPRVLFCADKSIDLMLKSRASLYMEFKSIDVSFTGNENGKLWNAQDSIAAIFKDKSMSLMEKNQLMRFFKLVQGHLVARNKNQEQEEATEEGKKNAKKKIMEEDIESPFVEFLTKMWLPPKFKLYMCLTT